MRNNFLIGRANIEDLRDILRLNSDLFKKEYRDYDKSLDLRWTYKDGKKYFKDRIVKKSGFVEIAEAKGKIIGYLCGGISERKLYRKKEKYAELENMLIKDRFRDQGIGAKLTNDFINWCKKDRVNYIVVTASVQNKQAIDFYRKLGFRDYDLTLEMAIKNN